MKENVFIYFPGCISSRNMLPFEAQGCRFIFEVVFNHPLALKFLLCLRVWALLGYKLLYIHRISTYCPWGFFFIIYFIFLVDCM